jgi:pSer/pThr/pTyr-binding forkhead associated (FHA) protein
VSSGRRETIHSACLVVLYGLEVGRKLNVDAPSVLLGRSSKANVQIDQDSVSRKHAEINNTGESMILRDLGSTHGTYVNDQLVDEHVLRDGDMVRTGGVLFEFLAADSVWVVHDEKGLPHRTIDALTQIYGHLAGDAVLTQLAALVRWKLRREEIDGTELVERSYDKLNEAKAAGRNCVRA